MENITPRQALGVLDQATQPGKALKRADYVLVEAALAVIEKMVLNYEEAAKEIKEGAAKKP